MADKQRIELYVPPGRWVSGDMTKKRTQTARGQPIPEDKQQFEFGVAIQKSDPRTATFFQQLQQAAHQAFVGMPHQATVGPYIEQWFQTMANFSMKVSDGDRPAQSSGKVNEHTAGHFVVWFSSNFPTPVFDMGGQPVDVNQLKRGYFIDVSASIAANDNAPGDGIGIYMNPQLIRFAGIGEEIRGGPDLGAIAAAMPQAPQLPAGAQPVGSAPMVQPMHQQQQPMQQPPMQQPPMQQPAPGMAPPPPVPGMVPNATPPATPGQASTSPGVQGGIPGMGAAPNMGGATTVSPGEAPPQHPGIMPPGSLPGM